VLYLEIRNYKLYYIINMCSCHPLLLYVCGAHNFKFDIIIIAYSVGVACVSV